MCQNEAAVKAPLQAKHESPYRLLTNESEQKLCTFNDQHYAKVNHTTKHITLAKQCTVPVFPELSLVQCAKCGRQHTVWSGRHTQIGRLTRGFVDSWISGLVDSWIRGLWVCEFVDRRFVDSWSRDSWIRG